MLEEHIREIELQSQERLIEEQKRHKELVQRLEVRPCPIIQRFISFSSLNNQISEFRIPNIYDEFCLSYFFA